VVRLWPDLEGTKSRAESQIESGRMF